MGFIVYNQCEAGRLCFLSPQQEKRRMDRFSVLICKMKRSAEYYEGLFERI